jgi:hypothetical protein
MTIKFLGNALLVGLLVCIMLGCQTPAPASVAVVPTGRAWEDAPATGRVWEDATTTDASYMSFIKTFHAQIEPGVALEVEAEYRPWLDADCDSYCSFTFTLRQGQDAKKWVIFDCDAVADKILQEQLVPIVSKDCILLRDMGKKYWKANPDPAEYTDAKGKVWKRQVSAGGK